MSNLREALEFISRAKPTPDNINRITAFAHLLDIPTNDVMFPIVASQLMIHDGIDEKLKLFLEALKASTNITKEDLVKAVSDGAIEVADATAIKQKWQWAAGCIAVTCLCLGLSGWLVYEKSNEAGYSNGYAAGYSKAADEKAAAAWANTPEGKMAYKLAQINQFKNLIHCDLPGWYIDKDKGACFVERDKSSGILHGWQIP